MVRRVCLFGLSADPPTGEAGHVGIVRALQSLEDYDEIWVLPVFRHTYSSKQQRLESFEHRLQMCQVSFAIENSEAKTKVVVSDAERETWKHASKNLKNEDAKAHLTLGTASLLDYLVEIESSAQFYFCLGADAFRDLIAGKWKESTRVLRHLSDGQRLVVLHRIDRKRTIVDKKETQLTQSAEAIGARVLQIDQLGDVSSSQVRECENMEKLSTLVTPEVLHYMQSNRLYQFATTRINDMHTS